LNLGVSHELHQRRQADASTEHVSGKGMSKPVRVSPRHVGDPAVMAEQGTHCGGCQWFSASPPFETDE
jgi:hypothetical protein